VPILEKNGEYVLFMHVPKAGGTSIEHTFIQNGWTIHLFDGGTNKSSINPVLSCSPQHWHADLILPLVREKRFKAIFATVRNPITRMESEYRWRRQHNKVTLGINDWVNDALNRFERDPFIHDNHIRPQSEFILSDTKLFKIGNGLAPIFEHLNQTLDQKIDFDPQYRAMVSTPKTPNQDSEFEHLSEITIDRLRHFYRNDFKMLDKI
jgi:Sulfotransferase family.